MVGAHCVTFLASDKKTVISSHPLAFLESYAVDIHNPRILTYSVVRKHMLSLIKKDELLAFSFLSDSEEKVRGLVAALDRYVVLSTRGKTDEDDQPVQEILFLHPAHAEALHTNSDIRIEGERFVCDKSQISAERIELLPAEKTVPVVAIIHRRGVILLQDGNGDNKSRGILESYSYKQIESFGATGTDCFGFKFREFYICLYSEESAHLMNTLAMRKIKTWEAGEEPEELPIAYKPRQ